MKSYAYLTPLMNFGGLVASKGAAAPTASSPHTSGAPSNSRTARLTTHGFRWYEPSAANHICQSSLGWCGATHVGGASSAPGLCAKSTGTHVAPSSLASRTISSRATSPPAPTPVMRLNRPYPFATCSFAATRVTRASTASGRYLEGSASANESGNSAKGATAPPPGGSTP